MTTSSTPDRGRALLMSTAAASFVLSAALVAGPALAANECGAVPAGGGTVTCLPNQTFPSISYPNQTVDLTLVTQSTDTVNGPITVTSTGAAIVSNAAPITTTAANSPGIFAESTGTGAASITTTGTITTSGTGSDGADAFARGVGNATITVGTVNPATGTVTTGSISAPGTGSAGVAALALGTGRSTITVNQGSTVSGDFGAVLGGPQSATAATATLYNNGTITGTAAAVYGVGTSVTGAGGAVTINNNTSGTLNGPIVLNSGTPGGLVGNTVNNAGTWNVNGDSRFGANGTTTNGTTGNVLNNTGIINVVTASGTATANTVTFTNLNTFNNAGGTIDLTKGESLNIDSARFNGGTGSTLRVNANSANGVLTLGSTGTGTTRVVLADLPGTRPAMNLNGATLVTGPAGAGGGPSPGSFDLGTTAGGGAITDQRAGFVDYRLAFNAATATTPSSYSLFGLPGPEVFEALNIPYALQDFWRHSADAFTQRAMSIRDSQVGQQPSRAAGWEFWAEPYGGEDFFKRSQTFGFGGFSFPGEGNHNDFIGLQVGADLMGSWGPLTYAYWGFTGGVEQQTTHFPGDDVNDLYQVGGNVGLYGGAAWRGFYANAVGKVDFDNMNTNFQSADNFSPTNTYKAYGVRGEVGYRWPWQGFFVEPSGRVNAIWSDSINLSPAGALLHFNNDDPVVQAQFGGRVGTTLNLGNMLKVMPGQFNAYVGAWYEDQYNGHNRMTFTTFGGLSPTTIGLEQLQTGNFIHMEYGLETADWYGGLKLFLKGENDFNGDRVGGWAAQGGVRWSF